MNRNCGQQKISGNKMNKNTKLTETIDTRYKKGNIT